MNLLLLNAFVQLIVKVQKVQSTNVFLCGKNNTLIANYSFVIQQVSNLNTER